MVVKKKQHRFFGAAFSLALVKKNLLIIYAPTYRRGRKKHIDNMPTSALLFLWFSEKYCIDNIRPHNIGGAQVML